jgi:hypothetical protein
MEHVNSMRNAASFISISDAIAEIVASIDVAARIFDVFLISLLLFRIRQSLYRSYRCTQQARPPSQETQCV